MKLRFAVFLLLLVGPAVGQESEKPILVDEFGKVNCDELLARADNFLIQKHNNPTMSAIFVTHGGIEHVLSKLQVEQLFRIALWQRQYEYKQRHDDPLRFRGIQDPNVARS
jgi:hypothetical protein